MSNEDSKAIYLKNTRLWNTRLWKFNKNQTDLENYTNQLHIVF